MILGHAFEVDATDVVFDDHPVVGIDTNADRGVQSGL